MPRLAQGEIWWADLPAPARRRPVLILTRSSAIAGLTNVTIAPLSRTTRGIASEVLLTTADGLPTSCVISLDNILTVPQNLMDRHIATLPPDKMRDVFNAMRFAFDIPK